MQRLTDPNNLVDAATLARLAEKISNVMTKMFRKPENGGNPFLFQMAVAKPHEIMDIPTACTNGKRFGWGAEFLDKLTEEETDTVMCHENWHVVLYHCDRLQEANHKVANLCVDWVVNGLIDRNHHEMKRPFELWGGNLGKPITLQQQIDYLDGKIDDLPCPGVFMDRSLDGKSAEWIYDQLIPHYINSPRRCHHCKAMAIDPKTGKSKVPQPWGPDDCPHCGAKPCSGGGSDYDEPPGNMPSPMDSHVKADKMKVSKQQVLGEVLQAAHRAKGMGATPAGLEEIIGELTTPEVKFTDIIRCACNRKTTEDGLKNNWTKFRRRYISSGQYYPTRHTHKPRWLCMVDTSGSMDMEGDITYGISQLQALANTGADGIIVPCDAAPSWDKATSVKKTRDLKTTQIVGRGGTVFEEFFRDYKSKVGKDFDCMIIITDGDCGNIPMNLKPPMDVIWVITNQREFHPTFGRVVNLRNNKH